MAQKKIADSPLRCLLRALSLSLAIHAVILLSVVNELPVRLEVPPATVKIVLSADLNQASVTSVPKSVAASTRSVAQPATEQPAVKKILAPAFTQHGSPVGPVETVIAAGAAEPTIVQPSAVSTVADLAPALPPDGVSANDLRQYRLSLAIAARRFKRYPALARERGWEGASEIALVVSAHLPAPEVSLVRSSGHPVLDRQAQEMMTQAARMTLLPEGLRGRSFRVLVPVQFNLDGDQ